MSLLNDMLHDLAKQKPSPNATPFPGAAFSSNRQFNLFKPLIIICFFGFVAGVLYLNHTSRQPVVPQKKVSFENETGLPRAPTFRGFSAESRDPVTSVDSSGEPLDVESPSRVTHSRVPVSTLPSLMDSSTQWELKEAITLDNSIDDDFDPVQDETPESVVNKVYQPQSLEEWHDAQLNKALKSMEQGQDEDAIAVLEEILVKVPKSPEVRQNLASLYLTYGDFIRAHEVLDEGLKYIPSDAALITIKARLYLEQGKSAEALNLLSLHHPSMTNYPDFYATLAAVLQSEDRIAEAGSIYKSLIQIDPNNSQYWLGYAISLEQNHQTNQAIGAYVRASQNPDTESSVRAYAQNRLKTLQG